MFDMFEKADKESQSITFTEKNVFVLSIGGSILIDEKPNAKMIEKISNSINALAREGNKFVLVVGGGKTARQYIGTAKTLGANNFVQDEIGIQATRLNAMLLLSKIENVFPKICTSIFQAKESIDFGKIPIFGGLIPSFTTDAVAALIAESLNGTFVNLSNVNGVYSDDPKQNSKAKLLSETTYDELLSIIRKNQSLPGQNAIIDLPAAIILKRSNIPAFFLNGLDTQNLESFIRGQSFKGTTVKPSPATEEKIAEKLSKNEKKKLKKFKKSFGEKTERKEDEDKFDVRQLRLD